MITREEAVERYRHQFLGVLIDVVLSGARGAEMSLRLERAKNEFTRLIGECYDLASRPEQKPLLAPSNGALRKEGMR